MAYIDSWEIWWGRDCPVYPPKTKCKHKVYSCDKCGTSDRVDQKHTTINGKGQFARLLEKDKKDRKL